MNLKRLVSVVGLALLAMGLATAKDSPDEQRQKIRKMAATTLADLYKLQPTAQGAVQRSAGYAVFNNMGTNLLLLSTARGAGVAVERRGRASSERVAGLMAAEVRAAIAQPLNATLLIAWLLSLFWHSQLGLQVVVEDYVHGWAEWFLQMAIRFLCVLGAIASVLAVCRIVFAA